MMTTSRRLTFTKKSLVKGRFFILLFKYVICRHRVTLTQWGLDPSIFYLRFLGGIYCKSLIRYDGGLYKAFVDKFFLYIKAPITVFRYKSYNGPLTEFWYGAGFSNATCLWGEFVCLVCEFLKSKLPRGSLSRYVAHCSFSLYNASAS
jgi:hypothetical protein